MPPFCCGFPSARGDLLYSDAAHGRARGLYPEFECCGAAVFSCDVQNAVGQRDFRRRYIYHAERNFSVRRGYPVRPVCGRRGDVGILRAGREHSRICAEAASPHRICDRQSG